MPMMLQVCCLKIYIYNNCTLLITTISTVIVTGDKDFMPALLKTRQKGKLKSIYDRLTTYIQTPL